MWLVQVGAWVWCGKEPWIRSQEVPRFTHMEIHFPHLFFTSTSVKWGCWAGVLSGIPWAVPIWRAQSSRGSESVDSPPHLPLSPHLPVPCPLISRPVCFSRPTSMTSPLHASDSMVSTVVYSTDSEQFSFPWMYSLSSLCIFCSLCWEHPSLYSCLATSKSQPRCPFLWEDLPDPKSWPDAPLSRLL